MAWTIITKWLTQLATWGTTVIVAHLLVPADYGIVGMAAIYINLFTLFSEFGIGSAIVTFQDLSDDQVSQLNALSVILGLTAFLASLAAAVPLGRFFRQPHLPLVIVVLSCGFIFSGIRTVPYSLLQKELRFRLLAMVEALQGVGQALLTLVLALMGFGYWALVLGILSVSATPTILILFWRRQSFRMPNFTSIRRAVHYSRHILVGRLCWAAYNDSDFLIAGRVLGAAPLGAYTLAWTLAHTPLEKLTTLVNRITPSVFAKIQNEPAALRRYLLTITGGMALVIFPATIGLSMVAPDFVSLIFGSRWNEVIIPLELLALHALIRSNVILLSPILNVIGEERLVMWNSIFALLVLPVTFYVGSHWGTVGIAAGWVVVYPLTQVRLFLRIFRRLNLPPSDYWKSLWPAFSGSASMALAVAVFKLFTLALWPLAVQLIVEILVGMVAYAAVVFLSHRSYMRGILRFVRTTQIERA